MLCFCPLLAICESLVAGNGREKANIAKEHQVCICPFNELQIRYLFPPPSPPIHLLCFLKQNTHGILMYFKIFPFSYSKPFIEPTVLYSDVTCTVYQASGSCSMCKILHFMVNGNSKCSSCLRWPWALQKNFKFLKAAYIIKISIIVVKLPISFVDKHVLF